MGFSFVDRLLAIDADRAQGQLHCPDGRPIPSWLVIEAVGQLAGWIAMARTDFSRRPVAALAAEIRLGGTEARGALNLEAHIERLDSRAILYSGTARCAGVEIASLMRCVGPLMPLDLFDDPDAVRARFAALRAGTAPVGGCESDAGVAAAMSAIELRDQSATCALAVPEAAPFFADHFPRRPVYPASLLAFALSQVGTGVATRALAAEPEAIRLTRLLDYKVRAFSPPGQRLEITADVATAHDGEVAIRVRASAAGLRVATGVFEYRRANPGAT